MTSRSSTSSPIASWDDARIRLTDTVSILPGANGSRYPAVTSMLVEGAAETVLIDPSVTVVERGGAPVAVDAIINSHGHEDHLAGNGLFSSARVHIHHDDLLAARSLDGLVELYGYQQPALNEFVTTVVEQLHYSPLPDASGFSDGHRFDLGGGTVVEAIHLPGHTRGHSGLLSGEVLYLSDIDLTGFGPYYGDAWSDLEQFEASLARARDIEATWYVTSHHKGVIEGRDTFLELIDAFTEVIGRRHRRMLALMSEPRSIAELVEHRFVYRPHVEGPHVADVERRTAELHLERMLRRDEATEVEPGRFQAQT